MHINNYVTTADYKKNTVSDLLNELCTPIHVNAKLDYNRMFVSNANQKISKVIFNDPATIVFWADGTKTVVKAQNEAFDPEKGLAMAIAKKFFGNKGNYCNQIKKWTEKYEEPKTGYVYLDSTKIVSRADIGELKCTLELSSLPWKIWMKYYNQDGKVIGYGVHPQEYTRKSSAVRRAKQLWGANPACKWIVSQTNPWVEENPNG